MLENQQNQNQSKEAIAKERLLQLFNEIFKILDVKYEDFNHKYFPPKEKIFELEKLYPELVVGADKEGTYANVSILGLMGTITNILCGEILMYMMDEDGKIIGIKFYEHDAGN